MKRLNKRKLIRALRNCLTILREIEAQQGVSGLARGIVEYRYNAESALKIKHRDPSS